MAPSWNELATPVRAESITPVILCGGSGTRLWPRSRPEAPKPFLPLIGDESLFQETLRRCRDGGFAAPVLVTGAAHVDLVQGQAAGFDLAEIIVEPEPKQTAAAIALAAERLPEEAIMLVCPSDHHIEDAVAFTDAAAEAARLATGGALACITVRPSSAETRFGYVLRGEPAGPRSFRVKRFVEKPDLATAEALLAGGEASWNAGIFAFGAGTYLEELRKHRPELAAAVTRAVQQGTGSGDLFHADSTTFADVSAEAVDYAVMENTDCAAMVEADMGWTDVGDWPSVRATRPKDGQGNAVRGDVELTACRDLLVDTDGPRVRCIGLQNIAVIVDGNDILVASIAPEL